MARTLRFLSLGLILFAMATGPTIAQEPKTEATGANVPDKPAADKPATEKPAIDKPAPDPAVAIKTAAANNSMTLNNSQIYSSSLAALTMLFVIAVLLENAFAVIFNWRVFLTYFSLKGIKTIVMIVVSLIVVHTFGVDLMASLIAAYKSPPPPDPPIDPASISGAVSQFVTALILAGGSAGVNRIMTALGFRSDQREDDVAPRPPEDKAWVAVRVKRQRAKSEIFVNIREIGPADATSPSPIAGVVGLKHTSFSLLFFRDVNRFPQNGGHTVLPNVVYSISVEAKDADGNVLKALDDRTYVFSASAIVDFEVTL